MPRVQIAAGAGFKAGVCPAKRRVDMPFVVSIL